MLMYLLPPTTVGVSCAQPLGGRTGKYCGRQTELNGVLQRPLGKAW